MTSATVKNRLSIGCVVRNAVVFNFRKWRDAGMNSDNLFQSVDQLFTLLEERRVDYLLVGGVAVLQYIEGRNTEDIDLIMALSSLKQLPEISVISRDADFIRGKFDELQIDLLLTENPLFARVQQDYSARQQFLERTIPCATVEGLIILKLYALPSLYRQGNFARVNLYENDVATLLYEYRSDVGSIFEVLAKYVSQSDLVSLKGIVADIQRRIEQFGHEFE